MVQEGYGINMKLASQQALYMAVKQEAQSSHLHPAQEAESGN